MSGPATQLVGQTPEILIVDGALSNAGAGLMEANGDVLIPIGLKTGWPFLRRLHMGMDRHMPKLAR